MNWAYIPAFDPEELPAHGGVLRTRQIRAELAKVGPLQTVRPGSARGALLEAGRLALQARWRWRLAPEFAVHYVRFHRALLPLRTSGITHCVYEHQAGPVRIGAMVALDLGFKVVAVPQNIEALATWGERDFLTGLRDATYLDWERRFLGRMSAVLTISREETWLLKNFGLNAHHYPYWPDEEALEQLRAVRTTRAASNRRGPALILGSAINAPTAEGITRLLAYLLENTAVNFIVVGRGVNRLRPSQANPRVEFRDGASNEKLNRLLAQAACACVHQDRGAGALMRVRHLLLGGVPVVCNPIAARDYFGEPGIFVYDDLPGIGPAMAAAAGSLVAPGTRNGRTMAQMLEQIALSIS